MQAHQDIVVDLVVRENACALESADQAKVGDFVRLQALQVLSAVLHRTFGRFEEARHNVEGGGLAGTVRPDQAEDLPLFDFEVHIRDRVQATELYADMLDAEDGLGHYVRSSAVRSLTMTGLGFAGRKANASFGASDGTIPRGSTNRMAISTRP